MKKFILKSTIFLMPILLLLIINIFFCSRSEFPDLLRLGYIPNVYKDYKNVFAREMNSKVRFHEISEMKIKKAKILTIGDSFSRQGNIGYNNYLAEKYDVLNMDRFIFENQVQTLYELLNGDFFERYSVEYVVLENVERNFVLNVKNIDVSRKIMNYQLDSIIGHHKASLVVDNNSHNFFSPKMIEFPLSMLRYYCDENYLSNEIVYNVNLKRNGLFSNNSNKLLFYKEDVLNVEENKKWSGILKLNDHLNDLAEKLNKKKVKLIVLPAPDKYDLYYDYIADKTKFPRPLFFNYLSTLKKDYVYIDSKKILSAQLGVKKDIYFYDDTHWSPVASKIISDEIKSVIID